MEYTTIQKTADRWGISKARVHLLCQEGRIPGAVYENKHWRVPVDAKKPMGTGPEGTLSASKKAKEWGVPAAAVTRLCGLGLIPGAVHIGRFWYIPEEAVYPLEGFIPVLEMAERWGMNRVPVSKYCKDGRILGAKRVGRDWYIPVDAKKPTSQLTERNTGYISPTKTAEIWGLSRQNVCKACREGRVPGAELINGRWHIPVDAENPAKKIIAPKLGYISTQEATAKWGIRANSVCEAANEGRIPGAEYNGGRWHIPENADAPLNEKTARLPGYTSASKTAEKWGVSRQNVYKACREGRIPGAEVIDGYWHIPEDAVRPLRATTSANRRSEQKNRYLSATEAAEKWGTSPMFVKKAARNGVIPGAINNGRGWQIPEDAVYPGSDGTRRK